MALRDFDATLIHPFFVTRHDGKVAMGKVYADKKKRFDDGDPVTTSTIIERLPGGVMTRNSSYRVVGGLDFQKNRTLEWLEHVFGSKTNDREERTIRLLEEVMELAQAEGVDWNQVNRLAEQVYKKPVGQVKQELGGVLVTLGSYLACTAQDPNSAYEQEFSRCESPEIIEKIRKKHSQKAVVSSKSRELYEA